MTANWAGRRATNAKRWCQANLGYVCWLCGRPIESEADYSVDHVVPRSVDRRHDAIGCPGNSGRGARPVAPRVNSRRW